MKRAIAISRRDAIGLRQEITGVDYARRLAELAWGRLYATMSRPYQDGDDATYDACRAAIYVAQTYLAENGETL